MAHISLYRRFRPDTFDKMVRQETVVRVLKNQIARRSVGHAYLFCGPRGTGKTSVARIFARAVNCKSPVDGSPCGTCATCRALETSLDIVEIDAASNNGVAEMRDLREKVQYPPTVGQYKVYIIDEVHMLTDSAFNALLKTLEEPPAHVIFILATTEPHKIPATILSRCMRLDFKLIPTEDLEKHLTGILGEIGIPYEREAVTLIARAGAGSDRDMLSIAEMCIAYADKLTYKDVTAMLGAADFQTTANLVSALLHGDSGTALSLTETALADGKAAGVLIKDILEFLRQTSIAKACRDSSRMLALPDELYAEVRKIADGADGRAILRAAEIFAKAENELRFTASPSTVLETAVAKASIPSADTDIDALLVRIAHLEEKLKNGNFSPAKQPEQPKKQAKIEEEDFDDGWIPPEEPVYDDEPIYEPAPQTEKPIREEQAERRAPVAPAPPPVSTPVAATSDNEDAIVVYGRFMRQLRKSKNGVLSTMCSDLTASYEKGVLVLKTESVVVKKHLDSPAAREIMERAFAEVGVREFTVVLVQTVSKRDGVDSLRRDFSDYPVDVK